MQPTNRFSPTAAFWVCTVTLTLIAAIDAVLFTARLPVVG